MRKPSPAQQAATMRRITEQRAWIAEHGGTREGYVLRYGSADDPEHYGNGGEAIFAADRAALLSLVLSLGTVVTKPL